MCGKLMKMAAHESLATINLPLQGNQGIYILLMLCTLRDPRTVSLSLSCISAMSAGFRMQSVPQPSHTHTHICTKLWRFSCELPRENKMRKRVDAFFLLFVCCFFYLGLFMKKKTQLKIIILNNVSSQQTEILFWFWLFFYRVDFF